MSRLSIYFKVLSTEKWPATIAFAICAVQIVTTLITVIFGHFGTVYITNSIYLQLQTIHFHFDIGPIFSISL